MSDLSDRIQAAVGETFRLERELGGGGMSRVFLAEEVRLGRNVVIKVLPPEMAAGVNKERFEREIKLAASLQHPHVVPLLTAGTADGDLLYYVMPYIEGESLRAKLAREGELPVSETVQILREVVDALAYAHRHEVVHRDIKPDNVLLSEGHAVVTDFGVAKAVSASSGASTSSLTSLGVALGTPAYMAPEQAAADPHVDHRADIYAVGVLAYEMLCGRPPFAGVTPQQVLAAHVSQAPEPITQQRETIPPAMAELVMRSLAKRAADRWQTAGEVKGQLDGMVTPSGGTTPTGTQPVHGVSMDSVATPHPVRVAALFGMAAAATLVVVYALMILLGLPDWVFVGAIALLAIGLPIMIVTGYHERRRAVAATTGLHVTTPIGVEKHFTWRKAILGGGIAFGGLAVMATLYMTMRVLGVGPVGTLMATGAIGARETLILAELDNRTTDTTLGSTVTELLRVSISQSPVVRLVDPARIRESLGRMQRHAATRVDESLALEIAEREGIKAIIAGEVVPLGSGYVVSARLVAASGQVLTAQHASARDAGEIIAAIDELSAKLRERIGESLRTIRRNVPLELVTTGSLEALRLYTQATQAEIAGDADRAVDLLEEAIGADTTFAMAYRKVGAILANNFEQRARSIDALTKAYEYRDRLTDLERGYATALYHSRVTGELENALAAYRTILDKYPDDLRALNNSGVTYFELRDHARALEYYERALAMDSTWAPGFGNVTFTQIVLGQFDAADRTTDLLAARFPGNPQIHADRSSIHYARGDYDAAAADWAAVREEQRGSPFWEAAAGQNLADLATLRGRLGDARRYSRDAAVATERRGLTANLLGLALQDIATTVLFLGETEGIDGRMRDVLARYPLDSLALLDRPYEFVISIYVFAGDTVNAKRWLERMRASGQPDFGMGPARQYQRSVGRVAMLEGDYEKALTAFRRADETASCVSCMAAVFARAFDVAGQADSTIHYWETFATSHFRLSGVDAREMPEAYRRLGELYEQRGEREKAVQYYNDFVELWEDADAELQSRVRDVRNRIARLVGEQSAR